MIVSAVIEYSLDTFYKIINVDKVSYRTSVAIEHQGAPHKSLMGKNTHNALPFPRILPRAIGIGRTYDAILQSMLVSIDRKEFFYCQLLKPVGANGVEAVLLLRRPVHGSVHGSPRRKVNHFGNAGSHAGVQQVSRCLYVAKLVWYGHVRSSRRCHAHKMNNNVTGLKEP